MSAPRQVAVGVLADEGLPERVITAVADELPGVFAAQVERAGRMAGEA
ncbi:hypothetical protein FHX81_2326 [Saccharothrix saharensis]|uniref:Uncharacterized protein n=1 Tax=Saccharothrix saharensis TaxID=571190 RepID=A0A543JAZ4_9PSEU|nr:hypothetical protein [Saccharothrix saharensis]TQM80005.1 hypothetical protein FHX81_2326 [Saccharothrix saharensis]